MEKKKRLEALRARSLLQASSAMVFFIIVSMFSCKGTSTSPGSQQTDVPLYFRVEGTAYYSTAPITDVSVRVYLVPVSYDFLSTLQTDTQSGKFSFSSVRQAGYNLWGSVLTGKYRNSDPDLKVQVDSDVKMDIYLTKNISALSPQDGAVVSTRHPTLAWAKNNGAASYTVELRDATSTIELVKGIADTSHTVEKELIEGVNYTWNVKAFNSLGTPVGASDGFRFSLYLGGS
jgi:hypothetical protein